MPTFCRHNRFIERCPICSRTLPGNEAPAGDGRRGGGAAGSHSAAAKRSGRGARSDRLRVRREDRSADDGYASPLVPGLRASADAVRLADEIAFSSARLAALAVTPPGTYEQAVGAAAAGEPGSAAWMAFLLAYLTPSQDEEPFAGVGEVLVAAPSPEAVVPGGELGGLLDSVPRGPRSSHEPGSGTRTLAAYAQWAKRAGGEAAAFAGDAGWSPERRFARLFERLSLPGLTRGARYEQLMSLGRLGIFDMRADSLQLGVARGTAAGEDATALAAKRVFGIGDPLLLDRRAAALAEAADVPLEALDLALFNWAAAERATFGFSPVGELDAGGAAAALGL